MPVRAVVLVVSAIVTRTLGTFQALLGRFRKVVVVFGGVLSVVLTTCVVGFVVGMGGKALLLSIMWSFRCQQAAGWRDFIRSTTMVFFRYQG